MTTERLKRNIDTSTRGQLLCIYDCATNNIVLHKNTLTALPLQTFHVFPGNDAFVKHELTDFNM